LEARAVLEKYFSCLEAGDFVGAAAGFSDSAFYSHPPYADDPPGCGRHEACGRKEILALFRGRGFRQTRHEIRAIARTGDRYFVSGVVRDAAGLVAASFVSEAVFNLDLGQFTEYVAYSSRPAVWAATEVQ
jgi:hypothetical protein